MKSPVFILCLLFLSNGTLQAQQDREGWWVGAGIGGYFYTSHWYYHRSDGNPNYDNYAVHKLRRTALVLDVEKRGLKTFGNAVKVRNEPCRITLDAGAQLLLGFKGQTKADWLAGEPVASSGGIAVGIDAHMKAVLLLPPASKNLRVAPFLSLGPQIMMIHNNGKGLESPASQAKYGYSDGWNEYLTHLVLGAGVNLEMGAVTLMPGLRLGLVGFGSSTWYPNGDGVTGQGTPGYWSVSITVAKKL